MSQNLKICEKKIAKKEKKINNKTINSIQVISNIWKFHIEFKGTAFRLYKVIKRGIRPINKDGIHETGTGRN